MTKSLEFVEVLRGIADRTGHPVGEVAIAWALRHRAVTGAIVGARDADQVDGFIGAMDFRLGEDDLGAIKSALPDSMTII